MSVLPITDEPPPPADCCDAEIHLPPIEFPALPDPALRHGRGERPDTVHIAPKRRAA